MSRSVTLVDLEPFRTGGAAERRQVADEIDEACRSTGFLQIVGHGIPDGLCARMLDVTATFFDQPVEVKRRFVVADVAANRGYSAEGSEALAYSLGEEPSAPDLFEAFNVGREDAVGPVFDRNRRFFAPNVWPDVPASMRLVWLEYQHALHDLNDHLLRAFALALEINEQFFIERTRRAILTLRAINYERRAGAEEPAPGQMRMGAHSDYGVHTILLADDVPGLQVRHEDAWQPVQVPPGSLIVNIGDMLATWTNDRWVSTLHRVVPPPSSGGGPVRRRSVAQFLEADPDCVVECLRSCTSPDNPPRYAPITAGEYLLAKLLGPRELRRSELPGSGSGGG